MARANARGRVESHDLIGQENRMLADMYVFTEPLISYYDQRRLYEKGVLMSLGQRDVENIMTIEIESGS